MGNGFHNNCYYKKLCSFGCSVQGLWVQSFMRSKPFGLVGMVTKTQAVKIYIRHGISMPAKHIHPLSLCEGESSKSIRKGSKKEFNSHWAGIFCFVYTNLYDTYHQLFFNLNANHVERSLGTLFDPQSKVLMRHYYNIFTHRQMSDKGEVQTEMAVQRNHSQFVVKMIILF